MAGDNGDSLASATPTDAQYKANVRRIFMILFFATVLGQIMLGALFDAYLQNIGGKTHGNALVGAVESVRGILQLLLAYPIGALSDRISRIRLLRYNLPFWTAGVVLSGLGVWTDNLLLVFLGMAFWAPGSQCFNATSQVIIADSVPAEQRTKVMANMTSLRNIFFAIGPLLQILLLLIFQENHWENTLLRRVILAGCVFWPGVIFWTLRLEDLVPLEKLPAAVPAEPPAVANGRELTATNGHAEPSPSTLAPSTPSFSPPLDTQRRVARSTFREQDINRKIGCAAVRWWLAVTLEVTTLITAFGAGMTVKFFPLFFRFDYSFTPLEVCLVTFAAPMSIAVLVQVCQRFSKYVGRLQAMLIFHFAATGFLWVMCFYKPMVVNVLLYLLRMGLMNARGPLMRAIIMDCVPSEQRGRWNSIQSLQIFSWSGSAALGGWLADSAGGDYRFTFAVTAALHTASGALTLPLLLIYPAEQGQQTLPSQETSVQLLERREETSRERKADAP